MSFTVIWKTATGKTNDFLLLGLVSQVGSAGASETLLQGLELLLCPLNVLQTKLGLDDLHVSDGVDFTLDVDNLGVVEAADDLEDTVDSANVRQESVAETSTGRCTSGQTGNVNAGEERCDFRLGLVGLTQPVEALIGDGDTRFLRL